MISPHSNNKEVIDEKSFYPMRYMVITVLYRLYYKQLLIYTYHLQEPLHTIIPYYVIFVVHIWLRGHINNRKHEWETHKMTLNSLKEKK